MRPPEKKSLLDSDTCAVAWATLGERRRGFHIWLQSKGMMTMKALLPALLAGAMLAGCSSADTPALEPIPGSITYGGQPRTKLTKSPVGSAVYNQFYNGTGQRVEETYILQPDRSLKLVRREIGPDFPD